LVPLQLMWRSPSLSPAAALRRSFRPLRPSSGATDTFLDFLVS
jgi:hypothetical protein